MKDKVILIAEDNPDTRELFTTVLEHEGYSTLHAENGAIAVVLAHRARPDLILMDIAMPTMDGYTAAALIREHPELSEIPILALTAHVLVGDARENIFDEIAVKPIEPSRLRALVAAHVSGLQEPPQAR